ncbi:hypothetical protein [Gemmiger formicilis]|jgi:hypothetical protein|uniref:hypothetical protein n=1 Tax=Gemmiger formicilis TaxID=745368 RepID=UPI00205259AB|nr:hypothetical protein [Gemmiger formicilis]UYI81225.1 MAG: hypothetical protein OGM08_13725 [Oscillospiraceae bacterium]DAK82734.1 MAG TPA: hypothetical protein [Caudoviricetes sp.]
MAKKQLAETTHKGAISKAGPHSSLKVVLSSLEYENKRRAAQGLAPLSYGKYVAKLERR